MYSIEIFTEDVSQIFDVVENRSRANFVLSLLHVVNTPELQALLQDHNGGHIIPAAFRFNLIPRSLHSVTNLTAYTNSLDARNDVHAFLTMYAKLYAYLQALETKYIYKVLGNMLRVLLNELPDGELYDDVHSGYLCYKQVSLLHDRLMGEGTTFPLFAKLDSFMDRNLRNAIAHNDIYLDSRTDTLFIPTLQIKQITHPDEAEDIQATYDFAELVELYQNATNFAEGFKTVVMRYIDLGRRY